ncbi:MAG TPA: amidohydrolase [Bacilli bacterium]
MPTSHELEKAAAIKDRLIAFRRELHQYPELSMAEYETTARIKRWVQEIGLTVVKIDTPVGVVAEVIGAKPGPTIALRADIDALPVTEETGYPFASQIPGRMHACGHDFHTAAMLGAAILLQEQAAEMSGRIRFIFQPGEEQAVGARALIDAGALQGVKAILGMHNKPDLPVGTIGLRPGPLMANVDKFALRIIGKGGHAAIPDSAVDPITAAAGVISGLQAVISRNISPLDQAVISVCHMQAGSIWNVIPDEAFLEGTVRTFLAATRAKVSEMMARTAQGIAAGYGAKAEFVWTSCLPCVNNDARLIELMAAAATEVGLRVEEARQSLGGEDFALYQEQVPGCYIWMGTSGTEEWHHPRFTLNEDALPLSAALFAVAGQSALRLFERQ